MKKSSIISLIFLCISMFTLALFSACTPATVKEIKFKDETVKSVYMLNEQIDYSAIKLIVEYSDQTTKESALTDTDKGVEYSPIDTSTVGQKVLSATYENKLAVKNVEVVENKVIASIKFKSDIQKEFYINEVVDYSKMFIIATYNDNSTVEIPLSDNAVEYAKIDTSAKGTIKFKVEYMEKTTEEITIEIKNSLLPIEFNEPMSYINYKARSTGDTYKLKSDVENNPYLVGSINKFNFVPTVTCLDDKQTELISVKNPTTVFKLYEKIEGDYILVDTPSQYVTAEDNMYQFNSSANDKFFKLEISLNENIYNVTNIIGNIEIEFKVVDAYNAYDTFGLSVVDNLNVKHWAELKDRTLKYDDKKLSEYTNVKLVVLHNDIVVNADELPENYFWAEDMYGYNTALTKAKAADELTSGKTDFAGRLKGSLRNGLGGDTYNHCDNIDISKELNTLDVNGNPRKDYAETWKCQNVQKAIFNTNQTSINGNYMTISTSDSETRRLTSILGHDYKEGDPNSMINQVSHWSMFKFYKTDDLVESQTEVNLSFENITLKGNMPKINEDGQEAGLMAMNTFIDKMTINNAITTQFYTHIVCDGGERGTCILEFNDSIMTDAYSNMFYLWRSNVTVNRSVMKNAGGPLFILCDANRTTETVPGPVLNIDSESELESYAAGTEAWYQMYNAQSLLAMLKEDINTPLTTLGKTFVHTVNKAEQVNIIAIMIPDPGAIFENHNPPLNIYGKVIRDGEEIFDMQSNEVALVKTLNSVGFLSGNTFAFRTQDPNIPLASSVDFTNGKLTPALEFMNSNSDILTLILSAKLANDGLANAPYFGVVLGDYLPIQK